MKVTRFANADAAATPGGGSAGGPAGGDLGGGYPAPTVTGLDGKSFASPGTEVDGAVPTYNSSTGEWDWVVPSSAPTFATPAIVLGTAAAAGAASTVIRSDSTIVAFDATVPTTQDLGDAAATGSAAVAARRDHLHGMPSAAAIASAIGLGPQHVHVHNVTYSGDGSTTVFVLPVGAVDAYSVSVFVAGTRTQDWTLTGSGILDTLTFGAAPASGTDNIAVDIAAAI